MIISASYRTDIPAFYAAWFRHRLHAGFAQVANPYGGTVSRVPLTEDAVDGFVFWTRNPAPFGAALEDVRQRGWPFVMQFTITGYPRALDAATVLPEVAAAQARALARAYGRRTVVWRYDPVVFSSITPPEWHKKTFRRISRWLNGSVDEVVLSVAQVYRKTARNMAAAASAHGFDWWDPDPDTKGRLIGDLAAIADAQGLRATLCGQRDLDAKGVGDARCIDAERLSDLAGRPIGAIRKPHRKACGCWQSKDIGAYDSCPHGCVYCYAVSSRAGAKRRYQMHTPAGDRLIPPQD